MSSKKKVPSKVEKMPQQDPAFRAKVKVWFEKVKNVHVANIVGIADELKVKGEQ